LPKKVDNKKKGELLGRFSDSKNGPEEDEERKYSAITTSDCVVLVMN
jgi:hypothetical protein